MFVDGHSESCHPNAFRLQTHPLLEPLLTRQKNLSTRTDNAMPWNSVAGVQCPRYLPRCSRISSGIRHVTIGRDLALGDASHLREHVAEHLPFRLLTFCSLLVLGWHGAILEEFSR